MQDLYDGIDYFNIECFHLFGAILYDGTVDARNLG
jgi:hypothetical protein